MIAAAISPTHKLFDPETESKDPYPSDAPRTEARFRAAVRFFADQDADVSYKPSREAATEYSPRRKPWEFAQRTKQPRMGERKFQ